MHVVATAGHVDHGKSSLILRLTGIDPDRWDEEKRRGLTIDLGFAWTTLPSGREIGFVDVPGHERFVRNMLAGVGPVRLVLFVVAADEGWKPQSEEHLEIVDVLGVDSAVVAVTKADLVEEDDLMIRIDEIADRLAGTALEGAPVVACSSSTGRGLDQLVAAIDAMVAEAPAPQDRGRPRIDIDRSFTIRGAGTVVTGTLTGGTLRVGDEVVVLPEGRTARIRSLQTHRRTVEVAEPVSRVAANLASTSREEVGGASPVPGASSQPWPRRPGRAAIPRSGWLVANRPDAKISRPWSWPSAERSGPRRSPCWPAPRPRRSPAPPGSGAGGWPTSAWPTSVAASSTFWRRTTESSRSARASMPATSGARS